MRVRETIDYVMRFRGIPRNLLDDFVSAMLPPTLAVPILGVAWMALSTSMHPERATDITALMYVALLACCLYLVKDRTDPRTMACALAVLFFSLSLVFDFDSVSTGVEIDLLIVVLRSLASILLLLSLGARWALLITVVAAVAMMATPLTLAETGQTASIAREFFYALAQLLALFTSHVPLRYLRQWLHQHAGTQNALITSGEDNRLLLNVVESQVDQEIENLKVLVQAPRLDAAHRHDIHEGAGRLLAYLHDIEQFSDVRTQPPTHYVDCDLRERLAALERQAQELLVMRDVVVSVNTESLGARVYRVDLYRFSSLIMCFVHAASLLGKPRSKLQIHVASSRISDSLHSVSLTLAMTPTIFDADRARHWLEQPSAGQHTPHDFGAELELARIARAVADLGGSATVNKAPEDDGLIVQVILALEPASLSL